MTPEPEPRRRLIADIPLGPSINWACCDEACEALNAWWDAAYGGVESVREQQ